MVGEVTYWTRLTPDGYRPGKKAWRHSARTSEAKSSTDANQRFFKLMARKQANPDTVASRVDGSTNGTFHLCLEVSCAFAVWLHSFNGLAGQPARTTPQTMQFAQVHTPTFTSSEMSSSMPLNLQTATEKPAWQYLAETSHVLLTFFNRMPWQSLAYQRGSIVPLWPGNTRFLAFDDNRWNQSPDSLLAVGSIPVRAQNAALTRDFTVLTE